MLGRDRPTSWIMEQKILSGLPRLVRQCSSESSWMLQVFGNQILLGMKPQEEHLLGPYPIIYDPLKIDKITQIFNAMVSCEDNADRLHQTHQNIKRVTFWSWICASGTWWSRSPPSRRSPSWQGPSVQRITFRSCRYARGGSSTTTQGFPVLPLARNVLLILFGILGCCISVFYISAFLYYSYIM